MGDPQPSWQEIDVGGRPYRFRTLPDGLVEIMRGEERVVLSAEALQLMAELPTEFMSSILRKLLAATTAE